MNILKQWNEGLFFNNYWGKNPCIIENFIKQNECEIFCPNELSSLSFEEDIVSRIINYNTQVPDKINLSHGLFTESDITGLPKDQPWSLLIQDAEKKTDQFNEILEKLNKIPEDFLDDIMISIGNINSGTGTHLDWYNVFILQVSGEKLWKVETQKRTFKEHDNSIYENLDVKILKNFNEYTQHMLNPGELLYIPPGHGHHGVASSELSMSFSIGYQGPRLINLIETYLSTMLSRIHEDQRINYCPQSKNGIDLSSWRKKFQSRIKT